MTTPGGGAGNEAATDAKVAAAMQILYAALSVYQLGSKKQQGVLNAIRSLTPNFAKQADQGLVPPATQQMALAGKPAMGGTPMPPMAPPGPGGPPGMPPGGAGGAEPPM